MNTKTEYLDNNKDEINLKEVFTTLKHYKYSLFIIAMLATIFATIFAYFSPNIYNASSTIYIKSERGSTDDFMSMALGTDNNNIENEIEILKSHYVVTEALKHLNIGTRIFTKKNLKTIELYQNAPFIIKTLYISDKAQKSLFKLEPINNEKFKLIIEPSFINTIRPTSKEDEPIYYSDIHRFSEDISTPWFNINIKKLYNLKNNNYSFTITPNEKMHSFIKESLSVSQKTEFGTIVKLSFKDNIPKRAVDILNAISSTYLDQELLLKTKSANKILEFLDIQLKAINDTLQNSAQNLEKYKSTNIVVRLEDKALITTNKLATLESEHYSLEMHKSILNNILTYIKKNKNISGLSINSLELTDPTINSTLIKIQEANTLYKSLLIDFTELHPDVLKVIQNLKSLRASLIQSVESTLRNVKDKKRSVTKAMWIQKKALEALPQQERELTQLTRNFMVNEKIHSFLLEKRAETAIIKSSTVSETRVVDKARVPKQPIKPKRMLIVIVGLILGFILGVSQALFRNYLDNSIKTVEDIESLTDIPLYGAIPILDEKNQQKQQYEEALRVIRTNLEFLQASNKSKLVTITSFVPTEGKTTTITELAKIIAKTHKKVIVLDLDMRRARIHEKFNKSNKKGMSTLLTFKHNLDEVIQHVEENNLDIITSGPTPPNPSELIMTTTMSEIIKTLLEKYDYVLLDTPPIGLVADAMLLMKISDLNLFVIRANYSKKDFIKNINRFVEEHDLNSSGIILNGLTMSKKSSYGYGYGYSYGYDNDYYVN